MSQPPTITSVQNPRVKAAAHLRDARGRQKTGRIIIDGLREIERALAAGIAIEEAFACAGQCDETAERLLAKLHAAGVRLLPVVESVFERLAFGGRSEGIVAVARAPSRTLDELPVPADAAVAVLVGLEKPGNVGAVLRSADGAGLGGVIVCDGGTDLFNPSTIRASLGTVFSLPLAVGTTAETTLWLQHRGASLVVTRPNATEPYTAADLTGAVALVLGAESTGLPAAWSELPGRAVRLPMLGAADSLNVSAAAAVLFYEALRQRGLAHAQGPKEQSRGPLDRARES